MNEVQLAALLAAAVAGLASLPHCFAMCGPLAVAGCGAGPGVGRRGAAYGVGRLLGYAAVGALLGRYGGGLIHRLADAHVNTVAAGLVVAVCLYHAGKQLHEVWQRRQRPKLVMLASSPSLMPTSQASRLGAAATRYVAKLLPQTPLGLGMVTAILPCGALVGAWVLAAASAHPVNGALSMLVFALASSPALMLAVFGRNAVRRLGLRVPAIIAAAGWIAVALLLVGRLWLNQGGAPCH